MADLHTGEFHQNVSEYFPMHSRVGKRKISIPGAKLIAAVATAAVAATLMLNTYVNCFATSIMPTSAQLDISVINPREDTVVEWQLVDPQGNVIDSGQVDDDQLVLDNLDPDTQYEIIFTQPAKDDQPEKQLGSYKFTTGKGTKPGQTPTPPPGPPGPSKSPEAKPEASPSPSISPSPSPSPSPSISPSPSPTPTPAPTPKPTPAIPVPVMGTPYVDNVSQGADSDPYCTLNFPYEMYRNDTYDNDMVSLVVTYTIEEDGDEYTDSFEITPEVTDNPTIDLFFKGSLTSSAVLTYNRTQYDADGNVVGVEENLTVTSDQLNIQSLYINSEWDNNLVGWNGGVKLSNVEVDENNQLTAKMTVDVEGGKYTAKNTVSEFTVPYSNPESGDTGDIRYIISGPDIREIEGVLDFTPATSTGSDITATIELDLRSLGLTAGETYTMDVLVDGSWLLEGVLLGSSNGRGTIEFTPVATPPMYVETAFEQYIYPTDSQGNGIQLEYIFTQGDEGTITGLSVTDSVAWYDEETGEVIGSETKPAVEYSPDQFVENGGQIWMMHTGTTDNSNFDNSNYYFSYKSKAELTYTIDGQTKTVTTDEFVLDPAFYAETTVGNSITVDQDSIVLTENGISMTVDVQLKNIHQGENTTLTPYNVYIGSMNSDGWPVDLEADNVTIGSDGSVTITDYELSISYGETNGDGTVTLMAMVDGEATATNMYGYDEYFMYSQTYAQETINLPKGYTISLAPTVTDSRHQPESNMTVSRVTLGTDSLYGLDTVEVYGGQTVYIDFELAGTPTEVVQWIANAECIDPAGQVTWYEEVIPYNTYTAESPFYITVMYTVPVDISGPMTLTPNWYVIEPN